MRRISLPSLLLTLVFSTAGFTQSSKPSLATPAISPDGKEIAFASGGDIWTVPADGGEARLLISNPADESRPLYSPDGSKLAFISTRTGGGDIYVLTLATGALQRLTFSDSSSNLDAWSRDGQWIYFTSNATDVAGQGDILRVRAYRRHAAGGLARALPQRVRISALAGRQADRAGRQGHLVLAVVAQRPRPHRRDGALAQAARLSIGHRRRLSPPAAPPTPSMPGPCGRLTARRSSICPTRAARRTSGAPTPQPAPNIRSPTSPAAAASGRPSPTTARPSSSSATSPSGSSTRTAAKPREVAITLRGAPSGEGVTHTNLTHWRDLAISPDGNKLAVVDQGEVFATGTKSGGEAQRLTRTDAAESDPQWSPDSTKVVYRSERDGGSSLYLYDFATQSEHALTHGARHRCGQIWSPDGKSIAFIRNRKELHVITLDGSNDRVLAHGELDNNTIAWSPDSHWVVYVPTGPDGFSNLFAVPAAGGAEARPLTFLANGETASRIAWSPDGKYILFDTAQRSETPQIARVDLIPHVPAFREDQFTELFRKQSTPGAPDIPSEPGTTPQTPRDHALHQTRSRSACPDNA